MSIKNEIDRIKQNVADAYNVIEDQGVVVQDDKSDYLDENMEGLFSNLEALVTDETVTEAIDLDDYDIIDITRVNVVNKDRTITANGTYLPPEGYAGFGEIVVDVDVNNEERTFTQNGTYYPSPDKNGIGKVTVALNIDEKSTPITTSGTYYSRDDNDLGGWNKVVVDYALNNEDRTVTQNGTYAKTSSAYDGLGTVTVALPLDSKVINHNGTYNASSDNLEGFTSVQVAVPLGQKPATITRNGTYYASQDSLDGYTSVEVVYDTHNQDKTVYSNGPVTFDSGYDGLGTVTVNTPYQGYLDDINTALTGLGITPPADYADIDTTITNSFGAILSELEDINGGTASNPLLDRITELEGYLNDIKTVLTNQGLTPPADYADLDTYINTAFNDIHNGLTDIHGES